MQSAAIQQLLDQFLFALLLQPQTLKPFNKR
jgi:hypothetical protein